ncbi:DNA-protecting protein DprA [Candidatus Peregrinibacteria bacterium]|nr:DNA-protecting protein DprA [Candidatus Peregrinibacteria bacterium]
MDLETKLFWASLDFLNIRRLAIFRSYFGNLQNAKKNITREDLIKMGIRERSTEACIEKIKTMNFSRIQKKFEQEKCQLIFIDDESFPSALRNIPDPPIFLFTKGTILPEDNISLAVVGTRKCSPYGKRVIAHILPEIIRTGFTIISGMAFGVDTEAHRAALKRNGRTLAVWGTGIDLPYPVQNKKLAREIEESGAIISEFPLGTPPDPYNFPRRNRLISGISLGVIVIEAQEKSGSLITARIALEQGKEVFAVPGAIFSDLSEGANTIIRKGEAKLVSGPADILEEFSFVKNNTEVRKFIPENEIQRTIFETLSKEGMSFDELVLLSKKTSAEVSTALLFMSMKGAVTDLGMNEWARNF